MLKKALIIGIVAAFVVTVGAIAYASIPGPDGVIHGCYKTTNPAQGSLIAIDSAATCPSGFAALNWNQTGPQGPAGANGVSGYEMVAHQFIGVTFNPGTSYSAVADCPAGKVVLGGGEQGIRMGDIFWDGPGQSVNNGPYTQWVLQFVPSTTYNGNGVYVYAACAFAS